MSVLLTGGSGLLGTELQRIAKKFDIEYIAPRSNELNVAHDKNVEWYANNEAELYRRKITTLVHCAAWTDVPKAEECKEHAISINILGTKNMRYLCQRFMYKLVYISTDYVYPGDRGNYAETDQTRPVNFYAFTKLAGEAYADKNDLIIRTSFKPSKWEFEKAFTDLYTSADYIDIIAEKISRLIVSSATGIYNVGTERKSIYDLAISRNPDVKPMSYKEIKNVNLPQDVSMNLDKYNKFAENGVL
jgi:dTDP-4-dehydrorhamnose reductase